jgi:hypothetical protein
VNLAAVWRLLLGACELIRIFVCMKETAVIILTVLVVAVQNLVARATRHPGICAYVIISVIGKNGDREMTL